MKIVPAKCPNCGANINVDEEQETTKCMLDICMEQQMTHMQIQIIQI